MGAGTRATAAPISQAHLGLKLQTAKQARAPAWLMLLSHLTATWQVGGLQARAADPQSWAWGRLCPALGESGGPTARLDPHGQRAEEGQRAAPGPPPAPAPTAPAGPGGAPGVGVRRADPQVKASPSPGCPGAQAGTHLDVFVFVLAFPAVPAGGAAAPHLPHRVFHGERVRVYGKRASRAVSASPWAMGPPGTRPPSPELGLTPRVRVPRRRCRRRHLGPGVSVCEGRAGAELARPR